MRRAKESIAAARTGHSKVLGERMVALHEVARITCRPLDYLPPHALAPHDQVLHDTQGGAVRAIDLERVIHRRS